MAATASVTCRGVTTSEEQKHSISLHYLAEGAANVVFKIHKYNPDDADHPPFVFAGSRIVHNPNTYLESVLRVSKGLNKTISAQEIKHHLEHDIDPLFGRNGPTNYPFGPYNDRWVKPSDTFIDHMMNPWLITLDDSVIAALNVEYAKHSDRGKGSSIPDGTKGLVMEDMSSEPGRSVTIELKPKWLSQSPNAPKDAYRCRNCALQAYKHSKGKESKLYICPIQILKPRTDIIEAFVQHKVTDALEQLKDKQNPFSMITKNVIIDAITAYLSIGKGHDLLTLIREIQLEKDEIGVLGDFTTTSDPEQAELNLRLAMTLRDCSLFIRYTWNRDGILYFQRPLIEARLGDLDFKSASKIEDWKRKEKLLIDDGWYKGRGSVPWTEGDCKISSGFGPLARQEKRKKDKWQSDRRTQEREELQSDEMKNGA